MNLWIPCIAIGWGLDGTIPSILLTAGATMSSSVSTGIGASTTIAKARSHTSIVGTTGAVKSDGFVGISGGGLLGLLLMGGHPGILPVPEGAWVTETVTNSYGAIAESLHGLEHVFREIVDSLLVCIMSNDKPRLGVGVTGVNLMIEDILGPLDEVSTVILVVISVNIVQNDVVSKLAQFVSTVCVRTAAGIRRPHVGRETADDVSQSCFVLLQLLTALRWSDLAEILVRPGVTGDLMATRLHAFDQGCPRQAEVIDLTLAIVDAGDEERGLCIIPIKQI
jgi:hypothetical protein